MHVEIHRCDICGADDSPRNPVSVRVSHVAAPLSPAAQRVLEEIQREMPVLLRPTAPTEDIDLCQECGRGLVALLRETQARREAATPAAAKGPAPLSRAFVRFFPSLE